MENKCDNIFEFSDFNFTFMFGFYVRKGESKLVTNVSLIWH